MQIFFLEGIILQIVKNLFFQKSDIGQDRNLN